MHPLGVRFGLPLGDCFSCEGKKSLSDSLLYPISAEGRLYVRLGKPAIHGNFLVDMTVRAADNALARGNRGRRQDINPFFGGLNRVMYYTGDERCAEPARSGYLENQAEGWNWD